MALSFFATCPKGLETLLLNELNQLGAQSAKETVCLMALKLDPFVSHLEAIGECQVMHQEVYGLNKWRKFNSPTFLYALSILFEKISATSLMII